MNKPREERNKDEARILLLELVTNIKYANPDVSSEGLPLVIWGLIEKGLHSFDLHKLDRLEGMERDTVINLRRYVGWLVDKNTSQLTLDDWMSVWPL